MIDPLVLLPAILLGVCVGLITDLVLNWDWWEHRRPGRRGTADD